MTVLVAGCGPVADSTPTPTPTPDPLAEAAARDAFAAGVCPIFDGLLALDPRLRDLRAAGAEGEDLGGLDTEIASVVDDLLEQLDALEALPDWGPGRDLRFQLITAVHEQRARLLLVAEDLSAADAAEGLANLPFVSSEAMDLAMTDAVQGGLTCVPAS